MYIPTGLAPARLALILVCFTPHGKGLHAVVPVILTLSASILLSQPAHVSKDLVVPPFFDGKLLLLTTSIPIITPALCYELTSTTTVSDLVRTYVLNTLASPSRPVPSASLFIFLLIALHFLPDLPASLRCKLPLD